TYDEATGLWDIGTLASKGTVTLVVEATVKAPGAGVVYKNTATVTASDQHDPDPDNDEGEEEVTPQQADIKIEKTVDNAVQKVGENVVFTITVENLGDDDATGVVVSDVLPTGYAYISSSNAGVFNAGTRTVTWPSFSLINGD